jgi:hypothetical protein
MAARVIHFGTDECYRITVLRSVGYSVDDCSSLVELRAELSTDGGAVAVCITEGISGPPEAAVSLAKTCSSAPLVLFRRSNRDCEAAAFDLVVDTLTPPQEWLTDMQDLIVRSQDLRARSGELARESAQLRQGSRAVREKSREERERSNMERSRNIGTPGFGPPEPKPPFS